MVKLVFNKTGDFLLHAALVALSDECLTDKFLGIERDPIISCIAVVELAHYKTLRELVNYVVRVKLASPATAVLLVTTDAQVIPALKNGAVNISAPISEWKNTLASLKRNGGNIDSVVYECMSYMNHHRLSPKQIRVIECLGKGMNPDEIAGHLFLSVKTVYTYIALASQKYGFTTSKKFHRYIINETVDNTSCTARLVLRLPLNDHIVW